MASPAGLLTGSRPPRRGPGPGAPGAGLACLLAGGVLLAGGAGPADIGELPPGRTGSAVADGGAARPDRTALGPAGSAPAGLDPAGPDPAGPDPAGWSCPAGPGPAEPEPARIEPAGPCPSGPRPPGAGPAAVADRATPAEVGVVPVAVALPGRGVLAPVVPVGTAPGGAMVIPDPPSTVGWWAPGPLVGGPSGAAVLAGHVDTAAEGIGALAVLREVGLGEPVVVRGADGRELRYVVTARREYPKADLPLDIFSGDGPPGLVLVTCGGAFDPATGHYADNVVVHAAPA